MIDVDGNNLTQLTINKSYDGQPYWTTDGYIYLYLIEVTMWETIRFGDSNMSKMVEDNIGISCLTFRLGHTDVVSSFLIETKIVVLLAIEQQ